MTNKTRHILLLRDIARQSWNIQEALLLIFIT